MSQTIEEFLDDIKFELTSIPRYGISCEYLEMDDEGFLCHYSYIEEIIEKIEIKLKEIKE